MRFDPFYEVKQIEAIQTEIDTYNLREGKEDTAYITIGLIEKILGGSYFHNKDDKNEEI